MTPTRRPRVALLVTRFVSFDKMLASEVVAGLRDRAEELAATLRETFDVIELGLVETTAEADGARERLAGSDAQAVVVAPAMAAAPDLASVVLAGSSAPVVLWNAVAVDALPYEFTQAAAIPHTTTVGVTMLANVLRRAGRPAPVVTTVPGDAAAHHLLRRTVTAAAAAGSLRGAAVLRVGAVADGYLNVAADAAQLAALGLHEVAVGPDDLARAFAEVAEDEQHSLLDELEGRGFEIEAQSGIDRSLRLAVALHALMDRSGAIAGTVNCAGPLLRFDERIGICACLGVACETARGRPLSCTGDQPAAIAAYLARRVGGASLYAEVYAPDATADAALVLGGPEADPAWAADDGTVRISPTRYVPGLRGDGAGVDFRLATGPATLLALAPTGRRWTLVCALGEIVESRYRAVRGPNGMFRFERRPVVEGVSALASAGATHHVALAPGHLDVEARTIAAFIDAELCEV